MPLRSVAAWRTSSAAAPVFAVASLTTSIERLTCCVPPAAWSVERRSRQCVRALLVHGGGDRDRDPADVADGRADGLDRLDGLRASRPGSPRSAPRSPPSPCRSGWRAPSLRRRRRQSRARPRRPAPPRSRHRERGDWLAGDRLDELHHLADLRGRIGKPADDRVGALGLDHRPAGDVRGLRDLVPSSAAVTDDLLGGGRDAAHALVASPEAEATASRFVARLVGGRRHRGRNRAHLARGRPVPRGARRSCRRNGGCSPYDRRPRRRVALLLRFALLGLELARRDGVLLEDLDGIRHRRELVPSVIRNATERSPRPSASIEPLRRFGARRRRARHRATPRRRARCWGARSRRAARARPPDRVVGTATAESTPHRRAPRGADLAGQRRRRRAGRLDACAPLRGCRELLPAQVEDALGAFADGQQASRPFFRSDTSEHLQSGDGLRGPRAARGVAMRTRVREDRLGAGRLRRARSEGSNSARRSRGCESARASVSASFTMLAASHARARLSPAFSQADDEVELASSISGTIFSAIP